MRNTKSKMQLCLVCVCMAVGLSNARAVQRHVVRETRDASKWSMDTEPSKNSDMGKISFFQSGETTSKDSGLRAFSHIMPDQSRISKTAQLVQQNNRGVLNAVAEENRDKAPPKVMPFQKSFFTPEKLPDGPKSVSSFVSRFKPTNENEFAIPVSSNFIGQNPFSGVQTEIETLDGMTNPVNDNPFTMLDIGNTNHNDALNSLPTAVTEDQYPQTINTAMDFNYLGSRISATSASDTIDNNLNAPINTLYAFGSVGSNNLKSSEPREDVSGTSGFKSLYAFGNIQTTNTDAAIISDKTLSDTNLDYLATRLTGVQPSVTNTDNNNLYDFGIKSTVSETSNTNRINKSSIGNGSKTADIKSENQNMGTLEGFNFSDLGISTANVDFPTDQNPTANPSVSTSVTNKPKMHDHRKGPNNLRRAPVMTVNSEFTPKKNKTEANNTDNTANANSRKPMMVVAKPFEDISKGPFLKVRTPFVDMSNKQTEDNKDNVGAVTNNEETTTLESVNVSPAPMDKPKTLKESVPLEDNRDVGIVVSGTQVPQTVDNTLSAPGSIPDNVNLKVDLVYPSAPYPTNGQVVTDPFGNVVSQNNVKAPVTKPPLLGNNKGRFVEKSIKTNPAPINNNNVLAANNGNTENMGKIKLEATRTSSNAVKVDNDLRDAVKADIPHRHAVSSDPNSLLGKGTGDRFITEPDVQILSPGGITRGNSVSGIQAKGQRTSGQSRPNLNPEINMDNNAINIGDIKTDGELNSVRSNDPIEQIDNTPPGNNPLGNPINNGARVNNNNDKVNFGFVSNNLPNQNAIDGSNNFDNSEDGFLSGPNDDARISNAVSSDFQGNSSPTNNLQGQVINSIQNNGGSVNNGMQGNFQNGQVNQINTNTLPANAGKVNNWNNLNQNQGINNNVIKSVPTQQNNEGIISGVNGNSGQIASVQNNQVQDNRMANMNQQQGFVSRDTASLPQNNVPGNAWNGQGQPINKNPTNALQNNQINVIATQGVNNGMMTSQNTQNNQNSIQTVNGFTNNQGNVPSILNNQMVSNNQVPNGMPSTSFGSFQNQNAGQVNGQQQNAGLVNGQQQNTGQVNGQQQNAGQVNGQQQNTGQVNGQQQNAGQVNGQQQNAGQVNGQQQNMNNIATGQMIGQQQQTVIGQLPSPAANNVGNQNNQANTQFMQNTISHTSTSIPNNGGKTLQNGLNGNQNQFGNPFNGQISGNVQNIGQNQIGGSINGQAQNNGQNTGNFNNQVQNQFGNQMNGQLQNQPIVGNFPQILQNQNGDQINGQTQNNWQLSGTIPNGLQNQGRNQINGQMDGNGPNSFQNQFGIQNTPFANQGSIRNEFVVNGQGNTSPLGSLTPGQTIQQNIAGGNQITVPNGQSNGFPNNQFANSFQNNQFPPHNGQNINVGGGQFPPQTGQNNVWNTIGNETPQRMGQFNFDVRNPLTNPQLTGLQQQQMNMWPNGQGPFPPNSMFSNVQMPWMQGGPPSRLPMNGPFVNSPWANLGPQGMIDSSMFRPFPGLQGQQPIVFK